MSETKSNIGMSLLA